MCRSLHRLFLHLEIILLITLLLQSLLIGHSHVCRKWHLLFITFGVWVSNLLLLRVLLLFYFQGELLLLALSVLIRFVLFIGMFDSVSRSFDCWWRWWSFLTAIFGILRPLPYILTSNWVMQLRQHCTSFLNVIRI